MEYDAVRRYSPHSHSYSNYYSRDRNTSLGHAHSTRVDPRGYQLSSPLGAAGMRARAGFRQDEHHVENGQSRRRIAIAVSTDLRDLITLLYHTALLLYFASSIFLTARIM